MTSNMEGLVITSALQNLKPLSSAMHNNMLSYLFSEFRNRYGPKYVELLLHSRSTYSYIYLIKIAIDTMATLASIYLNFKINNRMIIVHDSSDKPQEFTAKVLLDYIFKYNLIITPDNVYQELAKIEKYGQDKYERTTMQLVEIAVNTGTSKPFIQSVLTELIQNSVDAIRETILMGLDISPRIDINFIDLKFEDQPSTSKCIKVSDQVGIPLEHLPGLLLPFMSNKAMQNLYTTGEMGTGFFNVYRQPYCACVIIDTFHTQGIRIIATPFVRKGLVYDIGYIFKPIVKNKGTDIYIVLNDKFSKEELIALETDVNIFSRYKLGGINYPIFFNNQLITEKYVNIYENDFGTLKINLQGATSSMLFTNGVPFDDLISFMAKTFNEKIYLPGLDRGIIIDLKKTAYSSVQSRSNITGIDEEVENFIYNCLFFAICYKTVHNPEDYGDIFIHLTSLASSDQLRIGYREKASLENSLKGVNIINYKIKYDNKNKISLGEMINEIIDQKKMSAVNQYNMPYMVIDLIRLWFKGKGTQKITDKDVAASSSSTTECEIVDNQLIYDIIEKFIIVFWTVGQELEYKKIIKGLHFIGRNPPIVIFKVLTSGLYAFYDMGAHSITIDINKIKCNLLADYRIFENKFIINPVEAVIWFNNSKLSNILGNKLQANVIPHELWHAVRHDSSTGDHGAIEIILKGKLQNLDFDEGIFKVYQVILENNFWLKYFQH